MAESVLEGRFDCDSPRHTFISGTVLEKEYPNLFFFLLEACSGKEKWFDEGQCVGFFVADQNRNGVD
jgi:hypothetical protein